MILGTLVQFRMALFRAKFVAGCGPQIVLDRYDIKIGKISKISRIVARSNKNRKYFEFENLGTNYFMSIYLNIHYE